MAVETIHMNADGTFRLDPPFIVLTRGDQTVTWKLQGTNWAWATPDGVVCETTAVPPSSAWPGNQPALSGSDYAADANSPNTGPNWIYYKWTFSVVNTSTGQRVDVDPDIGNDPKP